MAVRIPDITSRIRVDTTGLDKAAKATDKSTRRMASGFGKVAAAAAAYGAASFLKNAVNDAREAAKVGRLTEAVLKSTGEAANVSAEQVGALSERLSAVSGIDDEVIQSGQNMLLTFTKVRDEVGKGNDIFTQATELGLDMAVALGTDAKGAALQLGKALNDPVKGITALSRAGVSFTEQQKEQIKTLSAAGDTLAAQKIILGELETQFGGAAEAAADPMARLTVVTGNLKEELGAGLLPIVDAAAGRLADMSPEARTTAVKMTLLAGGAGAAAIAIGKIATGVSAARDGLKAVAGPIANTVRNLRAARAAGESMGSVMGGVGKSAFIMGTQVAAAAGIIAILTGRFRDQTDAARRLGEIAVASAGDSANGQIAALERVIGQQEQIAAKGVNLFGTLYSSQEAADAADRVDVLRVQLADLKHQQELNTIAAEQTDTATTDMGEANKDAAPKVLSLAEAVDKVNAAMDRAEGKALDVKDATSAYEASVDAARKALKDSEGTLDLNTAKGRENHGALAEMARRANDATVAIYEQTGSVKDANRFAREQRDRLAEVADKFGVAEGKVDNYTGAIKNIPKRVSTRVNVDTKDALSALGYLQGRIDALGRAHLPSNLEAQIGTPGAKRTTAPGVSPNRPATKRAGDGGVTIQHLEINNPKTEPAGDSLNTSIRRARYLSGV